MRSISAASCRISSSVGDRAMVDVMTNERMQIPRISGSRKPSAVAPPMGIAVSSDARETCMAAIPV